MSICRKFGTLIAALATVAVMSSRADAAVLTIMDGTDTWTLNVQEGCTTCDVRLEVVYGAASVRAGLFLDAVQWDLTSPNVNPTAIGFNDTNAGTTANWSFSANNISANQCGGGSDNSVCGAWGGPGQTAAQTTAGGFGPIVAGSTLYWEFDSVFAATLSGLTSGNIRAAYNNANGSNADIFSPGGGNFTTTTQQTTTTQPTTTSTVPEPASLSLFGAALVAAAYRLRRRKTA